MPSALAIALVLTFAAVVALIAFGPVLPRIGAARVRSRLTRHGGTAEVSIVARPSYRLLRNAGDRLTVRGHDLRIGLADETAAPAGLSALDGFDEVDIELTDFRTGPLEVAAFVMTRSGGGSYAMAAEGTTSGRDLLRFGEPWLRSVFPGGGLLGMVAGGAPLTDRRVAVSIQIELISDAGGLRVGSGGGSIAGYPAGPLATTVAVAVARRLDIVP
jgi:hypothetical protein